MGPVDFVLASFGVLKSVNHTKITVVKSSDEKKIVYGVVLEPETVDLQGDIVSSDVIEKTAHEFMQNSGTIGFLHTTRAEACVVESYIARSDIDVDGVGIKKGSWVMAVKVYNDKIWEKVKSGELNSFSIGGIGRSVKE